MKLARNRGDYFTCGRTAALPYPVASEAVGSWQEIRALSSHTSQLENRLIFQAIIDAFGGVRPILIMLLLRPFSLIETKGG